MAGAVAVVVAGGDDAGQDAASGDPEDAAAVAADAAAVGAGGRGAAGVVADDGGVAAADADAGGGADADYDVAAGGALCPPGTPRCLQRQCEKSFKIYILRKHKPLILISSPRDDANSSSSNLYQNVIR